MLVSFLLCTQAALFIVYGKHVQEFVQVPCSCTANLDEVYARVTEICSTQSAPASSNVMIETPLDKWKSFPEMDTIERRGYLAPGSVVPPQDRKAYMRAGIEDIIAHDGLLLEIAPLHSPLLPPDYRGYRSVDVADRVGLLEKYKGHGLNESMIREPSYIWAGEHYKELVGSETFDLVVASHVLEHVPDLVGFLNDIEEILSPSGELRVIFPDHRYCFDWSRQPSRLSDIIAATIEKRKKPTLADVYDYFALVHTGGVRNNPAEHWQTAEREQRRVVTPDDRWHKEAMAKASSSVENYVDIHVWRFEPNIFYRYMSFLSHSGLINLELVNVVPTQPNNFEIFATFRRIRRVPV